MKEMWEPVVGLEEAYEISSVGEVRSLYREYYINGGLYNTGNYKQKDLAIMFEQNFQNISCIVNGKSWSSVTGIQRKI